MKKLYLCLTIALIAFLAPLCAAAQSQPGDVDIYAGIDFNYRDIMIRGRFTDLLINITPGVKWNLGRHWEIGASASIPIINHYGDYYKYVRINTAVVSKEIAVGKHWKTKFSGGIFTRERFGLDIKTMYAFNSWLAVRAQIGLTGKLTMTKHWSASPMKRITFMVGPDFWLRRWNSQLSLRGGRYLYEDYGLEVDAMRNFKHVSVGLYGMYSSVDKAAAGFKIIIMIPPYKRWCGKVHVRPQSNFRVTYLSQAAANGCLTYFTDAEENERTGWFSPDLLPWGQATMPPDFRPCPKYAPDSVASQPADSQTIHETIRQE